MKFFTITAKEGFIFSFVVNKVLVLLVLLKSLFFNESTLHIIAPTSVAIPLDIRVGKIMSDGL